jgi:heme exporter protein D
MEFKSLQFESLSEFWTMGGHGVFVWSVYLLTLIVFILLVLKPLARNKRFFIEQAQFIRRQQEQANRPE